MGVLGSCMVSFSKDGNFAYRFDIDETVTIVCVHCFCQVTCTNNVGEALEAQSSHRCDERKLGIEKSLAISKD